MPQVPRLTGPSVQEQALPNARVSSNAPLEAFGGGESAERVTQATNKLVETSQKLFAQEKQKADDAMVDEQWKSMVDEKNRITYDTKEGFLTRRGQNAFGAPDEYNKRFKDFNDKLEENLKNEDQKRMFRDRRLKYEAEFNGELSRHLMSESKQFENQQAEATLATLQDDAIKNYHQPGKVDESIRLAEMKLQSFAAQNGMPAEYVKLKMGDIRSKTHAGVVERMLGQGMDEKATQYFNDNKDSFTGKDLESLEKLVTEGSLRGNSQRKSDEIFEKYSSNMPAALEAARGIEDPKLRDEVTSRIKGRFSDQKLAQDQATEQLHMRATDIIDKTGDVDKIPVKDWQQFSLGERSALKSYAENKRKGVQVETDWDTYYNMKSLAATDVNAFKRVNLMGMRAKLGDTEFKQLVDLQTSQRNGDGKADKILNGFRTHQQIVNGALSSAGFDPTPKEGSKDAKAVNRFYKMVDDQILLRQQQTGKEATSTEVQDIVDNLMVEGTIPGTGVFGLFKSKAKLFELEAGKKMEIDVAQVPKSERAKIEDALRRKGMRVTDANILDKYLEKLERMVPRGSK